MSLSALFRLVAVRDHWTMIILVPLLIPGLDRKYDVILPLFLGDTTIFSCSMTMIFTSVFSTSHPQFPYPETNIFAPEKTHASKTFSLLFWGWWNPGRCYVSRVLS